MNKLYLGAVGNGETVALTGLGLGVDWLCVPRADSFPRLARTPDLVRGGALTLSCGWADEPAAAVSDVRQRYRGRTNSLETCALAGELAVMVLDYMPWGRRHLTRCITVTNGGTRRREARVACEPSPTGSSGAPEVLTGRIHAAFKGPAAAELAPGASFTTVLVAAYGDSPEEAHRNWEEAPVADLAAEERFWADWLAPARKVESGEPDLDEAYYRSLLALKLLCQERTGAILAAPTASGPAIPGGEANRDYCHGWLGNGYFVSRSLDAAGLCLESRRFYDRVLELQDGPDMAGPQVQVDSRPNVLHGLWCHWRATRDMDFIRDRWEQIHLGAEAVMAAWQQKENGIWEIRERLDHWVFGRALCAAGLHAAAEMADALDRPAEAIRWGEEALAVREDVLAKGWGEERQSYLQTCDDRAPLDSSALALSLWGLLTPDDPRLQSTVAAMEEPLRRPELVPSCLPTLWLARHYLRAGNRERALELVRLCLRSAGGPGLTAEQFDPSAGGQWGNFPQGSTHAEMALILLELFGEPAFRERDMHLA